MGVGTHPLEILTRRPAAGALRLAIAALAGGLATGLHSLGPQAQASHRSIKLDAVGRIFTPLQPLHRIPAIQKGPGLFFTPAELLQKVLIPRIEAVAEMVYRQIGGVAGVLKIGIAPLKFRRRGFKIPAFPLPFTVRPRPLPSHAAGVA